MNGEPPIALEVPIVPTISYSDRATLAGWGLPSDKLSEPRTFPRLSAGCLVVSTMVSNKTNVK